jgi:hypothetical protein
MYPPYNPFFRRLLVADSPSKGTRLAPYLFDLIALALILGTEEALRAGASWHRWAGELTAGIVCGVIGLRWSKVVALVAKRNPWEQLRRANALINELTEQLSRIQNNNGAAPAVKHVHTVRFEYLPAASPLQNGWTQSYNEDGIAEFGSDPGIPGSLRMKVTKGVVAIHHDLPPHATRANRIEFRARYSNTTMIFTRLIVATRDGSAQRKVDVKYYYGELSVSPTHPNPNPGRNTDAWLPEQTLHWPADLFDDECLGFHLPLTEVVKVLLGNQGWVFKSIEGIRLRGDLSISPIDLHRLRDPNCTTTEFHSR